MEKTRDLFKKTGDIKGTFPARMGTIKDRMGKDLTEAEEIKRLRQGDKNTQKNNIKEFLMTQITIMVWSLTQSQTFWSVKLSGPQEVLL